MKQFNNKLNIYIRQNSISQIIMEGRVGKQFIQITKRFNLNKKITPIVIKGDDFKKAFKDLEFCDLKSDENYLYVGDIKIKKIIDYKVDLINPVKSKSIITVNAKDLKINGLGNDRPYLDCLHVFVEKSKTYIGSTDGCIMLIHFYNQKIPFKHFVISKEMIKYVDKGEVNISLSDKYTILKYNNMEIIQKTRFEKMVPFFDIFLKGRSKRINILPLKTILKKYPKINIKFEKNQWILSKDGYDGIVLNASNPFKKSISFNAVYLKKIITMSDNCRIYETDKEKAIQFKDDKTIFVIMPLRE